MKKILYFDCFSGISGDMTIGALIDLGIITKEEFLSELSKLNVDGFHVNFSRVDKFGIGAQDIDVVLTNGEFADVHEITQNHEHVHSSNDLHNHEHSHESKLLHSHEHKHSHMHRNINDISKIIEDSSISENAKILSKKIFMRVAMAEAKVHGKSIEEVHFHEVGALDSIVDIVGTAILIDLIKPDKIYSSVINDGYGFIQCQHGYMPVPSPATAEIYAASEILYKQVDVNNEMVTPTGAAIIAELADSFGICPPIKIKKTGYGAGKRDFQIPNLLRVVWGETAK